MQQNVDKIFPNHHELFVNAIDSIAKKFNFDPILLEEVYGEKVSIWEDSQHLTTLKSETHALNEAARHARNLTDAMQRLAPDSRDRLLRTGAPHSYQIEMLASILKSDAHGLDAWRKKFDRTGGKNPAAHSIAEATRRFFRRTRKDITFAPNYDGKPSTEFTKVVEFAIGAFGVKSGWRRPAEAAFVKQQKIIARLNARAWKKRRASKTKHPKFDPKENDDFELSYENDDAGRWAKIKLKNRNDIAVLRIKISWFNSSAELLEYARYWANSNQ